jgi:Amt family ammonium transporter
MSGVAKAEVSSETAYILNTFLFLIHGGLVMFMAAGFAMLESGLVRSKNTAAICLKNIALYSTAASVVSGTVAERIKVWPFLIFVIILSAVIFQVQASWVWGGAWSNELGFTDFAGSTLVHSVGGGCALTGAIILGARK